MNVQSILLTFDSVKQSKVNKMGGEEEKDFFQIFNSLRKNNQDNINNQSIAVKVNDQKNEGEKNYANNMIKNSSNVSLEKQSKNENESDKVEANNCLMADQVISTNQNSMKESGVSLNINQIDENELLALLALITGLVNNTKTNEDTRFITTDKPLNNTEQSNINNQLSALPYFNISSLDFYKSVGELANLKPNELPSLFKLFDFSDIDISNQMSFKNLDTTTLSKLFSQIDIQKVNETPIIEQIKNYFESNNTVPIKDIILNIIQKQPNNQLFQDLYSENFEGLINQDGKEVKFDKIIETTKKFNSELKEGIDHRINIVQKNEYINNDTSLNTNIFNLNNQYFKFYNNVEKVEVQTLKNEIINHIVNQTKILVHKESTEVSLSLKPETLGNVLIKLTQTADGTIKGNIIVQNNDVKEIINNSLKDLITILKDQGVNISELNVGLNQGNTNNFMQKKWTSQQKIINIPDEEKNLESLFYDVTEGMINLRA